MKLLCWYQLCQPAMSKKTSITLSLSPFLLGRKFLSLIISVRQIWLAISEDKYILPPFTLTSFRYNFTSLLLCGKSCAASSKFPDMKSAWYTDCRIKTDKYMDIVYVLISLSLILTYPIFYYISFHMCLIT